ncbi:hypothetical protein BT69DRAFT_1321716, partial [Atractiella rhizophila]
MHLRPPSAAAAKRFYNAATSSAPETLGKKETNFFRYTEKSRPYEVPSPIEMEHHPSGYYDPTSWTMHPERGYWSAINPTIQLPLENKKKYHMWFRKNLWFATGGLRNWASRFYHLDNNVEEENPLGTILIQWHSFEHLKRAHKVVRSQPPDRLFNLDIIADLWPIEDKYTSTCRIAGLNKRETMDSVRKQFPYLTHPKLFFFVEGEHKHGPLTDRRYAIWQCSDNAELQQMYEQGPTDRRARQIWRFRPSCNIYQVEMDMRLENGEDTKEFEEKLVKIQALDQTTVIKQNEQTKRPSDAIEKNFKELLDDVEAPEVTDEMAEKAEATAA